MLLKLAVVVLALVAALKAKPFPKRWASLVYAVVGWMPVGFSFVDNLRDGYWQGWSLWEWLFTLGLWAVASYV